MIVSHKTAARSRGFSSVVNSANSHILDPKRAKTAKSSTGSAIGFTLIEVVMVLAISSLLSLMLLGGYQERQVRLRFSAALENVLSTLQSAKTQSNTTVNTRANAGTDPGQVVYGQVIRFSGSDISATDLVGAKTASFSAVSAGAATTSAIPWGITFQAGPYDGVIFARSPVDSENATLKTYPLQSALTIGDATFTNMLNDHSGAVIPSAEYIFASPENLQARLTITKEGNITLEYIN